MTMHKTLTLLGMLALVVGCAEGDDDRDDAAGTDTGTIGDDSSSGDAGMTMTGMTDPTVDPTDPTDPTVTTLTDPSGDPETSGGTEEDSGDSTGSGDAACMEYCGVYLGACVDFTEYANEADCLANCAQWPLGETSDTEHDSIGCRLYHATVAADTDPEMHCPHAGPSGAGQCITDDEDVPTCAEYCGRFFDNCTGELNVFVDEADCMTQCGTWYPGTEDDTLGHTVGCHSYHALAAMGDAEVHCPHAAPGGGGMCVL
jgi:hypothetical protein